MKKNLVKCNKASECAFHQQHNCPHGELHEEKLWCQEAHKCSNIPTSECLPLSTNESFELDTTKPIVSSKKVYVQQHGVVSSNDLVQLMIHLNKHAKMLHKFVLLVVVPNDEYRYNAIYSHHLLIKR